MSPHQSQTLVSCFPGSLSTLPGLFRSEEDPAEADADKGRQCLPPRVCARKSREALCHVGSEVRRAAKRLSQCVRFPSQQSKHTASVQNSPLQSARLLWIKNTWEGAHESSGGKKHIHFLAEIDFQPWTKLSWYQFAEDNSYNQNFIRTSN